ncbi:cell division protein PerM [Actinomadura formosensis]|uniref:cell division protein PerM n=1 Tax=Actinomadura formosensis TaxID=60706 RepID=UPI003D904A87
MSDKIPGRRAKREPSKTAAGRARAQHAARRPPAPAAARPLYVTGLVAALWCVGIGLAVLTTITLIGWIAAPKTALGHGLAGVFRTAVNFWLVSHHAGFSYGQGRVGLLPLGVLVLPGALLYRGGGWMIRVAGLRHRPRVAVVHVAVAQAAPYAGLAALLAIAASAREVRPSVWQALVACFLVAVIAGGLGAARAVVAAQVAAEARGRRVRSGLGALLRLLPERPRSLVIGVAGALGVLLASGAVLVAAALAMHMPDADNLYRVLAPGVVGGVLLLLVELAFLPNAVIWGMAYAVGAGFSVGAGTSVSPTGVVLDVVPAFPPLAALPQPGPAPALSLLALAAPFVAGAVGGVLTIRSLPSPVSEGAPLWGFVSGALTGVVAALLSALSGGPLGGGRMATVGPSAWQVGLLAALEVGIAAAIAAWVANWMVLRRPARAKAPRKPKEPRGPKKPGKAQEPGMPERRAGRPARPEPATVPLGAPVPGDYDLRELRERREPAPKAPHAPDPVEFEEADPVLAPRRPRRRGEAPPDPDGERTDPEPAPPPPGAGTVVLEGHIADEIVAEPRPGPGEPPGAVPPPRTDPGRTENRGGAIYVLREEPERDGRSGS